MKILKFYKPNKLLQLKLIKNRFYTKTQIKFNQTKLELKKQLKVVFKFFLFNKQILFLNTLKQLNKFMLSFLRNSKHAYLTNEIWFNGILTNLSSIFKSLVLLKNIKVFMKVLFNLYKTSIIVLFNQHSNFCELLKLRVPILNFGYAGNNFCDYRVHYYSFNVPQFFFYCFLNVIKTKVNLIVKKNNE